MGLSQSAPINGRYPLTQLIEVKQPEMVKDYFGNLTAGDGVWRQVPVFGWAVVASTEDTSTHISRTVDTLTVYAPVDSFGNEMSQFRLPDGTIWQQDAHPQVYDNNPWMHPGLGVITAQKVEG